MHLSYFLRALAGKVFSSALDTPWNFKRIALGIAGSLASGTLKNCDPLIELLKTDYFVEQVPYFINFLIFLFSR